MRKVSRKVSNPRVLLTLSAILALFLPNTPANAEPPARIDFKNNILPGYWTRHVIIRTTERSRNLPDPPGRRSQVADIEKLQYEQKAEWTQCNIEDPLPAAVMLYQMMVDDPARVVSLSRRGKKIKPSPKPDDLNLSKGSTRLVSAKRTPRDSPVQTPLVEQPEQCILELLLDFVHWPTKSIVAGHKWERDISTDVFEGKQQFEFVDLQKGDDETIARITLYATGKFKGILARKYEFDRMQAVIHWSRSNQTIHQIDAQAFFRRLVDRSTYKVKIAVTLQKSGRLGEKAQDDVTTQINAINRALKEVQLGHSLDGTRLASSFRQSWPKSMWMPAITELEKRVKAQQEPSVRFSDDQLLDILSRGFLRCQAALANEDADQTDAARRMIMNLNLSHSQMKKLFKSKDEATRSMVVFAMALSNRADAKRELYAVFDDASEKVRAVALIGLALRGDSDTDANVLHEMLSDKSAGVRSRACDAIRSCILRENPSVDTLIEKLDALMVHDDGDAVRLAAVRAIAAIGGPPDVAKLQKAMTHELDKTNRAEIERAIAHLEASGG
jgi:hypothetical protein